MGSRKEIEKDAVPSRFCHYTSENCKSQARKRKKEQTHMRNIKTKLDTSESLNDIQCVEYFYSKKLVENRLPLKQISPNLEHSYSQIRNSKTKKQKHVYNDENSGEDYNNRIIQNYMQNVKITVKKNYLQINTFMQFNSLSRNTACEIVDENCTTEIITRLFKKQVCVMKHEINCPFAVASLPIDEIKISTRLCVPPTNEIEISSKDNCLQHDINMNIMESLTRKSDRSISRKKSQNDKNKMQRKSRENDILEMERKSKNSNYLDARTEENL